MADKDKDPTFDPKIYGDALEVERASLLRSERESDAGKARQTRRVGEIDAEMKKLGRTPAKS